MKDVFISWKYSYAVDPSHFVYRLTDSSGTSDNQITDGSLRQLHFTLAPGKYHFQIFATTNNINSQVQGADITIFP